MIGATPPSGSDFAEAEESGVALVLNLAAKELVTFLDFSGLELTIMQSSSEASGVGVLRSPGISEGSVGGIWAGGIWVDRTREGRPDWPRTAIFGCLHEA